MINEYIRLLYRSSKKFKAAIDDYRKRRFEINRKREGQSEVEKLMETFFIPIKDDYFKALFIFIIDPHLSDRYSIYYNTGPKSSTPFEIDYPSIVVQIHRPITETQWKAIWQKHLKKDKKKPEWAPSIKNLKEYDKEGGLFPRKFDNLDLYLEIYGLSKEGLSPKEIRLKLESTRGLIQGAREGIYGDKEIKEQINKMEEIFSKL